MTLRAIRFIVALLIALGAGLVLVSMTGAQAQAGTPQARPDTAASPAPPAAVPEVPETPEQPVPAAPEPATQKPQPAPAEPESVPAKAEPAAAKPAPAPDKAEPAPAKPAPVPARNDPAPAKPEPAVAKPAPVLSKADVASGTPAPATQAAPVAQPAPATPAAPAPQQEPAADATSPSQEARQRLEQLRSNEYFYQSYGRDDPFRSLVRGKFERQSAGELVDIGSARLVGVVWSEEDQFALVEDGAGFGYILRVGDRVRNGTVVAVRRGSLTARVTLYGITSTVVLKLEHTEE